MHRRGERRRPGARRRAERQDRVGRGTDRDRDRNRRGPRVLVPVGVVVVDRPREVGRAGRQLRSRLRRPPHAVGRRVEHRDTGAVVREAPSDGVDRRSGAKAHGGCEREVNQALQRLPERRLGQLSRCTVVDCRRHREVGGRAVADRVGVHVDRVRAIGNDVSEIVLPVPGHALVDPERARRRRLGCRREQRAHDRVGSIPDDRIDGRVATGEAIALRQLVFGAVTIGRERPGVSREERHGSRRRVVERDRHTGR